jgi:carboxypeptidase C (cathepsin A)
VTVNERWSSPKYLFGESYGTTRSAGLADALQNSGISLNGAMLLSSILNYNILAPGIDAEYIGYLPSYAAIAWYHNKLASKPPDLKAYLEVVRAFARGPYAEALAQGDMLPPAQFDAIAEKVAACTGLSVEYVRDAKLRINASEFRKQLLRDQGEILGRYDARSEGTDANNVAEFPGYDPSDSGIAGAFTAAFHDYLTRQLKYESDEPYQVSSSSVGQWDWHHRAPGMMFGFRREETMPDVALDLADAMRKDPKMKVFSANGMFDLATPFFLTEFDINHMMLAPQLTKNVEFGYYPAGHMVYLNVEALKELVHDLDGFYAQTEH